MPELPEVQTVVNQIRSDLLYEKVKSITPIWPKVFHNFTKQKANAMGTGVSNNNQTGTVAIGYNALYALSSGAGNTAIGYEALLTETTGTGNTVIGYQAAKVQSGGSYNTVIGREAFLVADGTESNNIAIGQS